MSLQQIIIIIGVHKLNRRGHVMIDCSALTMLKYKESFGKKPSSDKDLFLIMIVNPSSIRFMETNRQFAFIMPNFSILETVVIDELVAIDKTSLCKLQNLRMIRYDEGVLTAVRALRLKEDYRRPGDRRHILLKLAEL